MRASRVLLRWYKSFNTQYHGYSVSTNRSSHPWDSYDGQHLPFVDIPLDRQITTIVGANECGKSHLLSALAKVFTGIGIGEDAHDYAVQDICRYCAFEGLDKDVWPNIGVELTFEGGEEAAKTLKAMGLASQAEGGGSDGEPPSLVVILDGARGDKQFAQAFVPATKTPLGFIDKAAWKKVCAEVLPALQFIDATVDLSNEVHVNQLLQTYRGEQPKPVFDPIALQALADDMLSFNLEANKPVDQKVAESYKALIDSLQATTVNPRTNGKLETLLFRDVLGIRIEALQQIAELGGGSRGYVERLVSEINHRIDETLDLTHFWEQDDEFRLTVDYKSGFFFFEITDKTGAKYTFNERSSGLRFFLSYYIQAKAIERANESRGSIVLMDEPDSYLSIAGQKNLLQVFESLVSPKSASGSCQLVYTTHSPFLINRNFPERLCLVRKGDGNEGSQFVPRSNTRRYEPIRSALGVDCGETLFMGANNIVVEGISDQRTLVVAIQCFGDPSDVDALLNLNTVTFVSAGGSTQVRRLVEKSASGDERRPIVVVLLDGDNAGNNAYQELTVNGILDKSFVTTIDQLGLKVSWCQTPKVLEDLIPPRLLAISCARYLEGRWNERVPSDEIEKGIDGTSGNGTGASRLVTAIRARLGTAGTDVRDEELKGEALDAFVDDLIEGKLNGEHALKEFEENVKVVCGKLRLMIDEARRRSQRDSLHKCVKLSVSSFQKAHHRGATRADMERCLAALERECGGFTSEARKARENLNELVEVLQTEVAAARDRVDMTKWSERLKLFAQCPWAKAKDGWLDPAKPSAPVVTQTQQAEAK